MSFVEYNINTATSCLFPPNFIAYLHVTKYRIILLHFQLYTRILRHQYRVRKEQICGQQTWIHEKIRSQSEINTNCYRRPSKNWNRTNILFFPLFSFSESTFFFTIVYPIYRAYLFPLQLFLPAL